MSRVKVEFRQTSKATYKEFTKQNPPSKISYNTYCLIISRFNETVRDVAFETGNKVRLPHGFGYFAVTKHKQNIDRLADPTKHRNFIPVDWKATKEAGHYVYHLNIHTDGYKYKLKWFIPSVRFALHKIWFFKPSRVTSRLLKHYITLPSYKEKYLEWGRF